MVDEIRHQVSQTHNESFLCYGMPTVSDLEIESSSMPTPNGQRLMAIPQKTGTIRA